MGRCSPWRLPSPAKGMPEPKGCILCTSETGCDSPPAPSQLEALNAVSRRVGSYAKWSLAINWQIKKIKKLMYQILPLVKVFQLQYSLDFFFKCCSWKFLILYNTVFLKKSHEKNENNNKKHEKTTKKRYTHREKRILDSDVTKVISLIRKEFHSLDFRHRLIFVNCLF